MVFGLIILREKIVHVGFTLCCLVSGTAVRTKTILFTHIHIHILLNFMRSKLYCT